jgi:hypothetical protein
MVGVPFANRASNHWFRDGVGLGAPVYGLRLRLIVTTNAPKPANWNELAPHGLRGVK